MTAFSRLSDTEVKAIVHLRGWSANPAPVFDPAPIEGHSFAALLDDPDADWLVERVYAQTPNGSPFLERQGWRSGLSLDARRTGSAT